VIPQLQASGWDKEWLTTVDIDRNGELKSLYGINAIPAFVVVKNGKVLGKRVGYVDHVTLGKWANGL
jgi:thioredoxin-like negative regulator of GroEL